MHTLHVAAVTQILAAMQLSDMGVVTTKITWNLKKMVIIKKIINKYLFLLDFRYHACAKIPKIR